MKPEERRAELRQRLLEAAEHRIAAEGLSALRARQLAAEVGCALGQIYNLYDDLDGLILAVNARTLDELEERLVSATRSAEALSEGGAAGVLVAQADTYLRYAGENRNRWQAVFEHRMSGARELPEWYRAQQARLFTHVDRPLEALLPGLPPERRARLGRSLFSAVHGIVSLGIEQLLGRQSQDELRSELRGIVLAIVEGLRSR
jgi:AcrR family transcriptional regulator